MKRLEPTHFIEVWKMFDETVQSRFENRQLLEGSIKYNQFYSRTHTIAIFLIKPQTTSLDERMERRGTSNLPNVDNRQVKPSNPQMVRETI